jgi:hypothetical protein
MYYAGEIFGPVLVGPPTQNGMVARDDMTMECYEKLQRRFFRKRRKKK